MKIKIQIKSIYGNVLFELEKENNTVKETVQEAVNQNANLRDADLCDADLRDADLCDADLRDADLRNANLRDADLRDADLRNANLRNANLRNANLRNANLRNANLRDEDLDKVRHLHQIIPEEGDFIAWKKLGNGAIAKLLIPEKAKRTCNLKNRKCRAEFVKVLSIERNGEDVKEEHGWRGSFIYKVGKIAKADSFDDDIRQDCSNGIHFFVTRREAEEW
jgi:hypothetical protein